MKERLPVYHPDLIFYTGILISLFIDLMLGIFGKMEFSYSFLPYTNEITIAVNSVCIFISLLFLKTKNIRQFLLSICLFHGIFDILTGFYFTGLFSILLFNLNLFSNGFFKTKGRIKLALFVIVNVILILPLLAKGIPYFLSVLSFLIFIMTAIVYIFSSAIERVRNTSPCTENGRINPQFYLPNKGEILNLKELPFSKRQISCILDTIKDNSTYKELGERLKTSESTIKKDMSLVLKEFGVKTRDELRVFLAQYNTVYF